MNAETEVARSPLDTPLLVLAVLIVMAAIGAFYYFDGQAAGWMRWLGMAVSAVVAVGIASRTQVGKLTWSYIQGSRVELRRVVWPTRKEATQTTLLIVLVVAVLSVALWGVDAVLLWAVRTLTGREV